MRLVQIHYTGYGGLAAVVESMVLTESAAAHEWIMGFYGVAPLDPSHRAFCRSHGFSFASFHPGAGKPWQAWRAIIQWLARKAPDAIVCHSITAVPPCWWHSRRRRIPLIAVEHTSNQSKSRNEWLGSAVAMQLADRVVMLSETYRDQMSAALGSLYHDQKIRIVPNGVDAREFRPRDSAVHESAKPRLGMALRFSTTKRPELAVEAAIELGYSLELAGEGETRLQVESLVARHPAAQVKFLGKIDQSQMAAWMRTLDMYVQPTDSETCSMSILQAMAVGLPILASDIPGMDEILGRDGRCGVLVQNEASSWIAAMHTVWEDGPRRRSMGAAARERAVQRYSADAMLRGYLSVIEELEGPRRRRPGSTA